MLRPQPSHLIASKMRPTFVPSRCTRLKRVLWFALAATVWTIGVTPSAAQGGGFPPYVADIVPARDVPAALAGPYGRAFVAEFAAIVAESADAQCLAARKITKERIADRARAIVVERGIYLWKRLVGTIDRAAYKSYLRARIGTEAVAELERLRSDPKVRAYTAAEEPARHAYVVSYILETMERHLMINRIKLVRGIGPYSTSDRALIDADPTEKVEAALKQMVASDTSGVLSRYQEMTAAAGKPFSDAIDNSVFLKLNLGQLLAGPDKKADGFRNDLARLCIK
jgi:hypothetical protein